MNKWLARILGIIIVAIVGLFFYDRWFNPPIPNGVANIGEEEGMVLSDVQPLDNGLGNQGREATQGGGQAQGQELPSQPEQPSITLTSLQDMESDHGAPVPVLANPQTGAGTQPAPQPPAPALSTAPQTPPAQASNNNGLRLESLAAANNTADNAQNSAQNAAADNSRAWIQAGSFGEKDNAERLAESIRGKKLPALVEPAQVNGKTYYRVYVGPIAANRVSDTLNSLSTMGVNARQVNR